MKLRELCEEVRPKKSCVQALRVLGFGGLGCTVFEGLGFRVWGVWGVGFLRVRGIAIIVIKKAKPVKYHKIPEVPGTAFGVPRIRGRGPSHQI